MGNATLNAIRLISTTRANMHSSVFFRDVARVVAIFCLAIGLDQAVVETHLAFPESLESTRFKSIGREPTKTNDGHYFVIHHGFFLWDVAYDPPASE